MWVIINLRGGINKKYGFWLGDKILLVNLYYEMVLCYLFISWIIVIKFLIVFFLIKIRLYGVVIKESDNVYGWDFINSMISYFFFV